MWQEHTGDLAKEKQMKSRDALALSLVGPGMYVLTANAATPPDACSLLTPAQVSAVLGIAVKAGGPSPDNSLCDWPPPSATNSKAVEVAVSDTTNWPLIKGPGGEGEQRTPVTGLGDDAVYLKTAGRTMLYVKKGKVEYYVLVRGFPPDEVKTTEKILAQKILPKL
jgi:hypothetical protein